MIFGDYCLIEQHRYGAENKLFLHKVIGTSLSNTWVDVPVRCDSKPVIHGSIEKVVNCICCGVVEDRAYKYNINDVTLCDDMADVAMQLLAKTPLDKIEY